METDVPGARLKRNQEIQRKISAWLLTNEKAQKRFMNESKFHSEVQILRDVLQRTDEAMQLERIPQEVRDRIVHCVIYGEPPKDARTEAEFEQRMQAYGLELQERLKRPELPPLYEINLSELEQ